MSEQTMRCKDCVLKHLAAAMSYAKEVVSGHGKGDDPDHRPDLLGELVNAEHHLELISPEVMEKVKILRTSMQTRDLVPLPTDVDAMREIWVHVEGLDVYGKKHTPKPSEDKVAPPQGRQDNLSQFIKEYYPGLGDSGGVGVLIDDEWSESDTEKWNILMTLILNNGVNVSAVLRGPDLEKYKGEYVWYLPYNVFPNRKYNFLIPVVSTVTETSRVESIPRVFRTEDIRKVLAETPGKPLKEVVAEAGLPKPPEGLPESNVCVTVVKQPCCTVAASLRRVPFARVTDTGWPFMSKIWKDQFNA